MKFVDLTDEQINQYKAELTEIANLLAKHGWKPIDMEWDNYLPIEEFVEEVFVGRYHVTFSNAPDLESGEEFMSVRFNPIIKDEAFNFNCATGPGHIMHPDEKCPQEFFDVQQTIQEKFGGIKPTPKQTTNIQPNTPQNKIKTPIQPSNPPKLVKPTSEDTPHFNNPVSALLYKFGDWLEKQANQ
jgi:hypothetical protein